MPGVNVNHRYTDVFNGIAVRADSSVTPFDLASVDKVKRVWPARYYTTSSQSSGSSTNYPYSYPHKPTGVEKAANELGLTGKDIQIGIIDTGVDYMHPELGRCWKTKGCMWQYGSDLVGDGYNPAIGNEEAKPGPYPLDCVGHGTHVAGIIAGQGPIARGVAPGATLGMYRVFGCDSASGAGSTSDDIILKALEMAFKDKSDIINLSLGGGSWPDEPLSIVAANIVKNGTVVVAASGNDGQGGLFTASSPAVGSGVINVGSVQNWNYTVADLTVRNAKSSKSVRTTLSTSIAHPFSVDTETPIVAPTITSSSGSCGNVTEDLTGKIAIFTVQPECSAKIIIAMLQQAGATDIIMINNKPGLIYPTLMGVNASLITVTPEDGRIIMDMIAAGPTKVKGPTSKPYYIPATDIAGQVSVYSSIGPDPYLNISPHITAPGGNIYSTIPVKYGGYFVMSGTSMACPFVSGAVALLKQERPNLTVDEISHLLSTTASPIANPSTGNLEHPYKIGSGLINIYDAVKARAKIFPPRLSLNSTTECSSSGGVSATVGSELWNVRNITLTNTDKSKDMYVTIDNTASSALSMYYPNGSIAYTPVAFGDDSSSGGMDNSKPAIKLFNPPKIVKAGQKATYTVAIIAPTVLGNSDKWFFGGTLEFKLQWASEAATSVYRVPYAGYSGDYSKLDVLAPPSSGFPSIREDSGMPLVPGPLIISENRTASVFFSMALPSHLGSVQLVNSAKKAVGYLPNGHLKFVPHTCPLCSLPILNFAINGTVFTDEELTNAVQVPASSYSIHAAFLRPLGNPDNSTDFQIWDSPVFTIV
ncbi:hypothetical protein IWW48_001585 [Coemansia sp. RSA 1200]|nr:hypothetical protein IWW48_001585 [Coemansia sp. RSA 1200]